MCLYKQWEEELGLVEQIKPQEYALLKNMTLISICFYLTALARAIFSDSDSWLFKFITTLFSLQYFNKQTV